MDSSIIVAIIAAVATIIAAIVSGYMQSKNKNNSDKSSEVLKDKIEAPNSNSYPVKLPQESIKTSEEKPKTDRSLVEGQLKPADITKALDSLPPYQRTAATESYIGQSVTWLLLYFNIQYHHDEYRVVFTDPDVFLVIHAPIDIDKYPEVKIAQRNDKVLVTGKISKLDSSTIYLEDPTFKFT
jgi:hypothetical protein